MAMVTEQAKLEQGLERELGIRAAVVMPTDAPALKLAATEGYGAEVVLHGTIWDEANEKAKELVGTEGLTYVHPFDDDCCARTNGAASSISSAVATRGRRIE